MSLFILPGLICNLSMFSATLAAFPGASGVDDFYGDCTDLGAMAEHALARAPERFALLGHSMGGRIALEVVRRAPQRVTALILADTGVHLPPPGEQDKRHALRDIGREQGFAALVDAWLPPMLSPAAREDATLVAALRAMCLRAGQARFEGQTQALLTRPEVEGLLPAITVPTLAITGEFDAWSPLAQHEHIAALIPGATALEVPGAGHMLPAEDAPAFNAAIARLLG